MASKLSWEWGERNHEIIIRKEKGKLTLDEIWNFLHKRDQLNAFDGDLAVIMFRVSSDRDIPFSLWGRDESTGDEQAVIMIEDDMQCPICGKNSLFPQYCPDCGQPIRFPPLPGDRS